MKICLLTPGQPSTNPRLVKEADALAAAGFDVTVVYAYCAEWASRTDTDLLAARPWKGIRVGGSPQEQRLAYHFTRLRYRVGREAVNRIAKGWVPWNWVLSRVTPELAAAAEGLPAGLYIAHTLAALPAALAGARKHGALVGFDAEDFYSEMMDRAEATAADNLVEEIESAFLPRSDYMTAAAPAMAKAYAQKYGIAEPAPILNVFSLEERPAGFRAHRAGEPLRLYWFSQTIGAGRGIEDAIRAMGMLRTRNIELYLQGMWAAGFREAVERLAAASGLERQQVIHLPPEPPASIARRASTYDVGLALEQSRNRNRDVCLTNKIFLYLLAGNAVVATRTSGQQPVIERIAPAGCSYNLGDVAALAACLEGWLRDREALETARRTAWDWGTREYNWDVEKEKFLGVVRRTLGCEARETRMVHSK